MKILSLIVLFMFFTFKIYGHGAIIVQGVEHEKGEIDDSVMTKAITLSDGDESKAKWEYNFATGNWSGFSGQIRNTTGEILACGTDPEYNSGREVSYKE